MVCVLRPQWQFIQSVFVELCRGMLPPEPKRFIQTGQKKGVFAGLWADYNLLLDRLEQAFGPENVMLLDFDSCRWGPGGVVGSVLSLLGLDPLDPDFAGMLEGSANVSPPALACWAATQIATSDQMLRGLLPCVVEALHQEYGGAVSTCLFTRKEFQQLQGHYRPLNDALVERRQPWQPEFSLEAFVPDGVSLFREDLSLSFWVRLARLGFESSLNFTPNPANVGANATPPEPVFA